MFIQGPSTQSSEELVDIWLTYSNLVSSEPHSCARSFLTRLGSEDGSSLSGVCRSDIAVPLLLSPLFTRNSPKSQDCNESTLLRLSCTALAGPAGRDSAATAWVSLMPQMP